MTSTPTFAERLTIGRQVYIQDLSRWVRGTISQVGNGSVTITTAETAINVHRSVYRRHIRLTPPKGFM